MKNRNVSENGLLIVGNLLKSCLWHQGSGENSTTPIRALPLDNWQKSYQVRRDGRLGDVKNARAEEIARWEEKNARSEEGAWSDEKPAHLCPKV